MSDDDRAEIDRIRQGLTSIWQIWMAWFCWFWGANVAVLWLRPDFKWGPWDALSWMLFNFTGMITAILLAHYCAAAGKRAGYILGSRYLGFPVALSVVGALFNALALLVGGIAWLKSMIESFGK